jgi:hypothetical protein
MRSDRPQGQVFADLHRIEVAQYVSFDSPAIIEFFLFQPREGRVGPLRLAFLSPKRIEPAGVSGL